VIAGLEGREGGERLVAGCMTGTSIDGLDAALVRVRGRGLSMVPEFVRGVSRPLGDLAPRLRALTEGTPMTAGAVAGLAREFAVAHASALRELLEGAGVRPAFVAVHGQTVYHAPPLSWQLFNAPVLAREVGLPVVTDLRGADLAAGGQGAPITPLADWVWLAAPGRRTGGACAVINLGGFCNVTVLPPKDERPERELARIEGRDVCACNHLLDQIARRLLRVDYDKDGRAALAGMVHDAALEDLGGVLAAQGRSRRSLGTGDELGEWISRWRAQVAPGDLAATACEGLGRAIAGAVVGAGEIYVGGGGARNRALVRAIGAWSSAGVRPIDEAGLPPEFREAAEMAVLGALCADGVPITLPAVTGVKGAAPLAGVWAV
jgi:1,6-anhydro-N-acetylmuramate kinase